MFKTKKIFTLAAAFLLFSTAFLPAQVKEGQKAPDFTVELLDGTKTSLYKLTGNGKAVLLNFWATWCPPCRKELPDMNKLSEKLNAQGDSAKLSFFAVCISDEKKNCQSFMTKNKFTFTTAIDEQGDSATLYGVQGIPTSFLISSDNTILKSFVGMMSAKDLKEFVKGYEE